MASGVGEHGTAHTAFCSLGPNQAVGLIGMKSPGVAISDKQ